MYLIEIDNTEMYIPVVEASISSFSGPPWIRGWFSIYTHRIPWDIHKEVKYKTLSLWEEGCWGKQYHDVTLRIDRIKNGIASIILIGAGLEQIPFPKDYSSPVSPPKKFPFREIVMYP